MFYQSVKYFLNILQYISQTYSQPVTHWGKYLSIQARIGQASGLLLGGYAIYYMQCRRVMRHYITRHIHRRRKLP
jgi:hypothetical protein